MSITSEKNIILLTVIIFFALIAVLFYVTSGKRIEERGLVQEGISPSPSVLPLQTPMQKNAVQVQEDSGIHSSMRYEHGSFSPVSIAIANETGCFVEIQNASDEDVVVRLGPYDPQQERGFLYPPIAPHENSLIDPRYGTITQFSFYNKNNPSAIFAVSIDPTCF